MIIVTWIGETDKGEDWGKLVLAFPSPLTLNSRHKQMPISRRQNGLGRVQAVFSLLELPAGLGLEDLVRNFKGSLAVLIDQGPAFFTLTVVVGRESVHEDGVLACLCHKLGIDLVGLE